MSSHHKYFESPVGLKVAKEESNGLQNIPIFGAELQFLLEKTTLSANTQFNHDNFVKSFHSFIYLWFFLICAKNYIKNTLSWDKEYNEGNLTTYLTTR